MCLVDETDSAIPLPRHRDGHSELSEHVRVVWSKLESELSLTLEQIELTIVKVSERGGSMSQPVVGV